RPTATAGGETCSVPADRADAICTVSPVRLSMKGPDSPLHRRISRAVALAALAIATLATVAPSASADVPTSGALYRDGPSGRYLVGGAWYRRADPRDTGRRRGW